MSKRYITYLLLAVLLAIGISAAQTDGSKDKDKQHLPEYYWSHARSLFEENKWSQGKAILDKGLRYYPDASPINEQMGRYYYHFKQYNKSRYYLMHALKDDNENVNARQLLVNVEEETGNYSSAICYVNELLEVNPYWRGLWRRKIQLFRKQGNDVEADRLLRRINQIYPSDTTLRKEYAYALESNYLRARKTDKKKAIAALKEMAENGLAKEEQYLALSNLQLQSGDVEAASLTAGIGAERLHSASLARKKASILAGQERYAEAMTYVRSWQRNNHNSSLTSLYNSLQTEAAEAAARQDPYVLYGRVYEQSKSSDALTYLVNTSFTRQYDDDALYYLNEALKKGGAGNQHNLLYKKYVVLKRKGDVLEAQKVLAKLYAATPNDYDIKLEVVRARLNEADGLMQTNQYSEAIEPLDFVAKNTNDAEIKEVALRKMYNCYYNLKKYKKAMATLDVINSLYPMPTMQDLLKRANTLDQMDEHLQALALLQHALDTCSEASRQSVIDAYEESALPYIKKLQEEGATRLAYEEVKTLLSIDSVSSQGLKYAVNLAVQEQDNEGFEKYLAMGRVTYPEDVFFIVKQAEAYGRAENYQDAIDLLRPVVINYPGNEIVRNAFSEQSELRTLQLLKQHENQMAMNTVDSALHFDNTNSQLLYTKGLVYESMHEYDSAHYYQRYYKPSLMEIDDLKRHLNSLQNRAYRHDIGLTYLRSRYTEDEITAVASLSYKYHAPNRFTYGLDLNYAGRDGDAEKSTAEYQITGGMGIQILPNVEWEMDDTWTFSATAGWANKYFPKWTLNAEAVYHTKNDWDFHAGIGYRHINTYKKTFSFDSDLYAQELTTKSETAADVSDRPNGWIFNNWERSGANLIQLNLGADKTIESFWLSTKLQSSMLQSSFYVNWTNQVRFFPVDDGVSYVGALASIGTAPEASVIDYALPSAFSHLNAMVGLGGKILVHKNIALGLMGTWSTYYNQVNRRAGAYSQGSYTDWVDTSYKNLFTLYAQLYVRF